ncbi:MAG: hypothetical protein HPY50_02305 [Firmicutes bacterium]|nr:hypothetical protein [Bacillota bacterium]
MPGILFIILAVFSILIWIYDPASFCTADACQEIPGLLERSWYLWAAFYYTVAATLILALKRNRFIMLFLAGGLVFHAGLIATGYILTSSVCWLCVKFFGLETCITLIYIIRRKDFGHIVKLASGTLSGVMAALALVILLVNPAISQTETIIPVVTLASDETKSVSLAEINREPSKTAEPKATEKSEPKPAPKKYLAVTTPDGRALSLDITKKPALVYANWCPHCDDALQAIKKQRPENRPYMVITYLRENETENSIKKLEKNGLSGEPFYFLEVPPPEIQSVPVLLTGKGVEEA